MGKVNISHDLIKELISYDPDTGIFTWNYRDRRHFTADVSFKTFNSVYAGNRAGSIKQPDQYRLQPYEFICINGMVKGSHRWAWFYFYGEWPEVIDHINGIGTDNRISNLRNTNYAGNARNRPTQVDNKLRISGVRVRGNGWNARITVNNRLQDLGGFRDLFSACCARKSAELKYGYHENHGRLTISDN